MRDKNLFHLLLGLNLALAVAFVAYLFISSHRNPRVTTTRFTAESQASASNQVTPALTSQVAVVVATNLALTTNPASALISTHVVPPEETSPKPVFTPKKFGWKDLETDGYKAYVDSLRAVGCPEEKVRYIILSDINELIDQKRLQEAVTHDQQWWRAEPEPSMASLLREKGASLDEQRQALIRKWLGEEAAEAQKSDAILWSNVQLTGPVLGALDQKTHQTVQEICGESIERYQSIFWSSVNSGQPLNQVDLAGLRQRTRSELVKVLAPQGLEEFLLRYSHNANHLRQELRGFDPTPEEFRKIFLATDAMDHAMQMEYGTVETMSTQQRERYERQRDQAIKEVLGVNRFRDYLLTKDPLYKQAQMMAMQYGAPSSAVQPIYEVTKANETKRQQIMQDTSLTPEQKRQAVNNVFIEQRQSVQRIAADARAQK